MGILRNTEKALKEFKTPFSPQLKFMVKANHKLAEKQINKATN